jgi:hypothetical protein
MSNQPKKRLYYIENLGGEKLQNTLVHEKTENNVSITEHPSMKCLDLAGRPVERHLWEVPHETLLKCRELVGKDGVRFNEYSGWSGEMPKRRTIPDPGFKKPVGPFRFEHPVRRHRRRGAYVSGLTAVLRPM